MNKNNNFFEFLNSGYSLLLGWLIFRYQNRVYAYHEAEPYVLGNMNKFLIRTLYFGKIAR